MRVWSLRHPPVDRQGRCIGQSTIQTTEPLQASVRRVVASAPFEPTRLFCSDLPRCSQLAEGLALDWNIELEVTEDLREMNFGEWEGRSYNEIDATDTVRWRRAIPAEWLWRRMLLCRSEGCHARRRAP